MGSYERRWQQESVSEEYSEPAKIPKGDEEPQPREINKK